MASSLTVRNLSSASFSISCVERFEDPNTLQSKPSIFSFSSANTSAAAPSASKLGEHAGTFNRHDLNTALAPFESFTLNHQQAGTDGQSATLANTTLRLTIEGSNGERFRVDINPSYTQKSVQSFTPLSPKPSSSYTALFHPTRPIAHLTIHANHLHDYRKWMEVLPPTLPLSALSIPGTHNSHTCYRALPSVRCQVVPVETQLEHGIRFLDIRIQPAHPTDTSSKDLYLVHGAFPVSLTGTKLLEPVIQSCYDFLSENPSETILISLKREGIGSSTDEHLAQLLEKHYITPNANKWYTDAQIPYLGAVRGKLVLIRRYTHTAKSYGLDATEWPSNSTNASHGPFCVQDFCDVLHPSSIAKKLQYSNEHLVRAAEQTALIPGTTTDKVNPVPPGPLYLNFLSGANFWHAGCWPDRIAKIVNRGIEEWVVGGHHLEEPLMSPGEPGRTSSEAEVEGRDVASAIRRAKDGDGGAGVVIMDCVGEGGDWDLVELIVGLNMGVRMKVERGV